MERFNFLSLRIGQLGIDIEHSLYIQLSVYALVENMVGLLTVWREVLEHFRNVEIPR
jgi:hypothetical protein